MARHKTKTRLVWLSAIENNYPFYGNLQLEKSGSYPTKSKNQYKTHLAAGEAWIYPELRMQLGINIGDAIGIGAAQYKVSDIIIKDNSQVFQNGAIAPKIIVALDGLKKTNLIKKGSNIWHGYYFKTPLSKTPPTTTGIENIKNQVDQILNDNSKRVITPQNASENMGRVIGYVSDFLGLIALVAFFMATIGSFFLYRSYLSDQRYSMTILHSLGMNAQKTLKLYLIHLVILALAGSLLAVFFTALIAPLIFSLIKDFISVELSLFPHPKTILIGCVVGLGGCLLTGVPLLIQRVKQKLNNPFQSLGVESDSFSYSSVFLFLPWCCYFIALSIYISHSIQIGLLFSAIFLFINILTAPFFIFLIHKLSNLHLGFFLNFIFRDFKRFKTSSLIVFLNLVMSSFLLTLVPNIESSLLKEVESPKGASLPSIFLFDIQEEQLTPLSSKLEKNKTPLMGTTPMIVARLLTINGQKVTAPQNKAYTRERQRQNRFRNRGVNLTYRSKLGVGEKIISGEFFKSKFNGQGLPEISVEKRYAKRLGIRLHDKLAFDVLGINIEAKVTSIRSVQWTTFMPNFFIVFQPGVLEDAPKTYLGAVGQLATKEKELAMLFVYENFPNISSIDVSRLIGNLLKILKQVKLVLNGMGILSFLVCFFVIGALIFYQINRRKKDWALLKVLGFATEELRKIQLYSLLFLSTCSGVLGIILSYLIGYGLTHLFFDGLWSPPHFISIVILITLIVVSLLMGEWATRHIMRVRSTILLRQDNQ